MRHGLHPVDQEVQDRLSESLLVCLDDGRLGAHVKLDGHPLAFCLLSNQRDDGLDNAHDVARGRLGRIRPHQVELPRDDGRDTRYLLLDDADELVALVIRAGHRVENLDGARHAAQRISDLVRDSGRQRTQGGQAVQEPHPLKRRSQLLVRLRELFGGLPIALPLPVQAVDQKPGNGAEDQEQDDLRELVRAV